MSALSNTRGQSVIEAALAIPLLLLLLAAGYWLCTHLFLAAAVESVAHAQLLRSGRGQPDISSALAATVLPGGRGVHLSAKTGFLLQRLPPFSGLTGRTVSSVNAYRRGDEVQASLSLPQHRRSTSCEATVDSWSQETSSGNKVRRAVQGVLITGAFR